MLHLSHKENRDGKETTVRIYGLDKEGNFDHAEMSEVEEEILYSLMITWLIKHSVFEEHEDYVELSLETLHPYIYGGQA